MFTKPPWAKSAFVPVVTAFDKGVWVSLIPILEEKTGSKESMFDPTPRVELTNPELPVAAPPEATVVPPAPPPDVAPLVLEVDPPPPPVVEPMPVPVPPGVFWTTPVETPRADAPDFVRSTSVSAIDRL